MEEPCLIGVDIGTQGTKAALYSVGGTQIASAFEPSRLINPAPGTVEQEPDEIYSSVLNTIKSVMEKSKVCPSRVAALGLDGQMAGILGIDYQFNAITCYDSWLDTRCEKYVELIKKQAEEKVISVTGCPVTYAHGPKILWWKNEKPEIYKHISKFVVPSAYAAGRLCGLNASQAYIDYTQIHFSGFADVEKMKWSDELLSLFDVDKGKMPRIAEPWEVVGTLTKEAAAKCGLLQGTKVVAGCGDQAAASLGAGITRQGQAFDVAGTASVFSCCVDKYLPDVKNKTLLFPRSVIKGLWIPLAYISGGGLCVRWFKEQVAGSPEYPISYPELESLAEKVNAGSNGLIFIPHFSGRTCPNVPDVRGSFLGLGTYHSREHLFRAVMESIGYEYRLYYNILRELGGEAQINEVFAVGGGAKSRLFNQIKCDILGLPYQTLQCRDSALLGSAIVAGYGAGVYDNIAETADKMTVRCEHFDPNKKNHEKYIPYVKLYEQVMKTQESLYSQMKF